ncbi:cold-regulated 413 plasma membrane protein 2-like [Iris pallida]|uniref:Cold-regulated 413 plasma membrane protein 2-like n=1 Tax=Iris pallida TaxID=29817 RepID=A0AAX6HNI2_IRIPA|nr:cold-regulated 413 plasma membrane protein 2-like [Iris pallida]
MDRTNWKTNMLTSLLIPYIFLSLPTILFSFFRSKKRQPQSSSPPRRRRTRCLSLNREAGSPSTFGFGHVGPRGLRREQLCIGRKPLPFQEERKGACGAATKASRKSIVFFLLSLACLYK